MATRRVVRERIDPRLTGALFANYRSPLDAILELVDNAVDSRVAGRPLDLELVVHPGRLVLTVVGGEGMSPAAIERDYLRWGASSKKAGDRIGRYGQGGKAAIGHLGNRFEVVASAAGDEHAYGFEDPASATGHACGPTSCMPGRSRWRPTWATSGSRSARSTGSSIPGACAIAWPRSIARSSCPTRSACP